MRLTESQLIKMIMEELEEMSGVLEYEVKDMDTEKVVTDIFVDEMDGAPSTFQLFAAKFMPEHYFKIEEIGGTPRIVTTELGQNYIKKKGFPVDRWKAPEKKLNKAR
jgi:hypothetical protein